MKTLKLLAPATLGVLALTLSVGQAQAAGYTAVDLHWWPGSYPGGYSSAWAINNGGQVVGHTSGSSGFPAPTLWSGSSQSLLANYGVAMAINDNGFAAGTDNVNALVWSNGTPAVLPSLSGSGDSSAYGINNSGQVVGYSVTSSNKPHATFWDNGSVTDLGTLGGNWSFAWDINNPGQTVGTADTLGNFRHAALWENGSVTDLGDLGYGYSNAYSINDSGQIVGNALNSYNSVAVLWENGIATALPNLSGTDNGANSAAYGINNAGLIVGSSYAASGDWYAALWQNGAVTDLNTLVSLASGVYLREARGINDLGQIIANGSDNHAYLLTPDAVSNVPVPAAGWLFGSALLGAAGLKRRRRQVQLVANL